MQDANVASATIGWICKLTLDHCQTKLSLFLVIAGSATYAFQLSHSHIVLWCKDSLWLSLICFSDLQIGSKTSEPFLNSVHVNPILITGLQRN